MGDTGSERSKPPPRCSCGFWGSSKTMNLCSKCFTDIEKKQPGEDCAPEPAPSSSNSQSVIFYSESSSSSSQSLSSAPVSSEDPLLGNTEATPLPEQDASESESDASPEKRARVGPGSKESLSTHGGPKQKRSRRCHRCQTKLELVQQELGSCRCGYVFCMLHRLPEQHDCLFDHLGRGREEAVLKMVKLDRKVGRSCQRIGEECS
ncbi:AN1-type zinc finger protein 3 isoform X2 [Salmo salar]|uniref:AN1-type zinc finger protein 3 isoform X2 n=1 Tax=Salmo salar TaxID=8030 RepID=A0A1S3KSH2_SALSA|nr:AN1-type zinc finger protein 3 isoform X2 [Salmo salar]|eukprot:XP_013981638.1 PREDICTED: AN1-type zinc finger protein 3-like isoform X2 [Salmo salar]